MTPEELARHGYNLMSWNGGTIPEYWKPLRGDDEFNYRIGVRFNEYKNRPFAVWLTVGSNMHECKRIKNVSQLNALHFLLSIPPE